MIKAECCIHATQDIKTSRFNRTYESDGTCPPHVPCAVVVASV